uniref:bifunctional folylpolyglutamate synthase/dihydrofolate synthase n=1 Tax=Nitrospira cf. moscoviensis SBR1015 TaxID=96242 RepID=UPI000B3BCCE6|nr:Mur ligase family protein [Nitrospira cf. moscoviensis SBR1015]
MCMEMSGSDRHAESLTRPFQSLADVQSLLDSRINYESNRKVSTERVFVLDRMVRCVEGLGRPDRAFRTIHVTGTKGKGSVSRVLAALLRATGARVGLYTSPHVEHLLERVSVDGMPVSERTFVAAFNELRPHLEETGKELTHFELLTAAAFCAFRIERVDWAVIEVGIGGRLDATNVILPEVCVITTVDYDHMDLLGDTLEQIAFEKAGIVKPNVPVVVGAMGEGPRAMICSRAAELDAPVFLLGQDYEAYAFARMDYRGICSLRVDRTIWQKITLNCPAAFMATNAAYALAAFQTLWQRKLIPGLTEDQVHRTLESVNFPACCEVFPGRPTVVIDGSHNAMAAASLATIIRTLFESRDRVLVVGIPRDKEVGKLIAHFAEAGAQRAIFTRYPGIRATPPEELAPLWQQRSAAPAEVIEEPDEAFARAVKIAGGEGVVIVTGSIHLAGVLRPLARVRHDMIDHNGAAPGKFA